MDIPTKMDSSSDTSESEAKYEENHIEEIDDQDDEFYFESDHVALKNNKDYVSLLKTICILEAQRIRGLKDIDTLLAMKKKVNENPLEFLDLFINNKLEIPRPQVIAKLPNIAWSQYNMSAPELEVVLQNMDNTSRKYEKDLEKGIYVRGRMFTHDKPQSFNQLWSPEEQNRLDELLVKYPVEAVETNRWRKISADLGSRTPKQVCSRVQKYFLKLQKVGLPIPGRAPKAQHNESLRRSSHPHQKTNKFPFRPSTFFPSHDVPVHMIETEDDFPIMGPSTFNSEIQTETVDDYKASDDVMDRLIRDKVNKAYKNQIVQLLQEVLQIKESGEYEHLRHYGSKCNICNENPILGVKWHCMQCEKVPVDYCSDCVVTQMESDNPHPFSHKLVPVKEIQTSSNGIYDSDYLPSSFAMPGSSYNYLDPNFMPL